MLYLWLALLGLAVGGFGTLIGAGGGFLLMPILALMYPRESPSLLASMSLAVVFFNALSGSIGYARMKRIDYRAGGTFALATVPGAIAGAIITGRLDRKTFDVALAVAIVGAAAFILVASRKGRLSEPSNGVEGHPRVRYNLWLGVLISLGVGFVSSLLGIGGGIIHVPALVLLLNFPVHIATATSHFVLAITAATGSAVHVYEGVFQHGVRRTAALAVGVVIGAQIGARLSTRIRSVMIMRSLAVALILVAIRIVWDDFR